MDLLWNLFFSLQIVCYLVIYDVPMPANVGIFIEEFTKLIEFRMMSINNLGATFTGNSDFNLMKQLTDNDNSILNDLSVYLVIAAIFILAMLLVGLAFTIQKCRRRVKKVLSKTFNKFFFNGLIRSITIAYIKICISSGQQVEFLMQGYQTKRMSEQVIGLVLFVAMFGYPFISVATTVYFKRKLNTYQLRRRIANFYSNIEVEKGNWALAYYTIFLVRRIVFVAIPIFLVGMQWLQIQLLLMMSSLYFIYYAENKPHSMLQRNRMEIFNESMIMLMNYHMVCFSKFNLSPDNQFSMGYSFVICIGLLIVGNLGLVILNQIRALKLSRERKQRLQDLQQQFKHLKLSKISQNHINQLLKELKLNKSEIAPPQDSPNSEEQSCRSEKKLLKPSAVVDPGKQQAHLANLKIFMQRRASQMHQIKKLTRGKSSRHLEDLDAIDEFKRKEGIIQEAEQMQANKFSIIHEQDGETESQGTESPARKSKELNRRQRKRRKHRKSKN